MDKQKILNALRILNTKPVVPDKVFVGLHNSPEEREELKERLQEEFPDLIS